MGRKGDRLHVGDRSGDEDRQGPGAKNRAEKGRGRRGLDRTGSGSRWSSQEERVEESERDRVVHSYTRRESEKNGKGKKDRVGSRLWGEPRAMAIAIYCQFAK